MAHQVKSNSITHLKRECGLTDVYEHHHKKIGDTSNEKNHKIDYLLISHDILPMIIRSGFLPWESVLESDHRTGFADFSVNLLFGTIDTVKTNIADWKLHTTYAKRVLKY